MHQSDDLIVSTADVLGGRPRFVGTRVPVTVVLDNLAAGGTEKAIHEAYPTLPEGAIPAALRYAARLVRDEEVTRLPPATA